MTKYILLIVFIFLSIFYYSSPLKPAGFDSSFLSVATFLFAIFTGFFISRQGNRYSLIRNENANFDGYLSALYRYFGHFGAAAQRKIKETIEKHHSLIIKNRAWDYHFTHKSNTICQIHEQLGEIDKTKKMTELRKAGIKEILRISRDLQLVRKRMISLHQERIPRFQWTLIIFLGGILLITVSALSTQAQLLPSLLKGAFSTCVILVLILLYQFDNLKFFENTIGERSRKDMSDIFSGKR